MDSININGSYIHLQKEFEEKIEFINDALKEIDFSYIHSILGNPSRYMISGGGKRLRPILCSLCTELIGGDYRKTKDAFIALELIHNATLIHDDIIDGDSFRRGEPSVPFIFGGKRAVLTGDALFALGLKYAANTKNPFIVKLLSETALKMVQGVALQSLNRRTILSEKRYFEINYFKSGSLFETATAIGGVIGSGKNELCKKMTNFGKYFGNAYQIRDDICSIFHEDIHDDLTKNDLINGDISLPFIYALNSKAIDKRDKEVITETFLGNIDQFNIEEIRRIYIETSAIKKSILKMNEFAEKGRTIINSYVRNNAKDTLMHLLEKYYFNFEPEIILKSPEGLLQT